jgi:hypothetical protein
MCMRLYTLQESFDTPIWGKIFGWGKKTDGMIGILQTVALRRPPSSFPSVLWSKSKAMR